MRIVSVSLVFWWNAKLRPVCPFPSKESRMALEIEANRLEPCVVSGSHRPPPFCFRPGENTDAGPTPKRQDLPRPPALLLRVSLMSQSRQNENTRGKRTCHGLRSMIELWSAWLIRPRTNTRVYSRRRRVWKSADHYGQLPQYRSLVSWSSPSKGAGMESKYGSPPDSRHALYSGSP